MGTGRGAHCPLTKFISLHVAAIIAGHVSLIEA